MWIIELNLDKPFEESTSWHIDDEKSTIESNLTEIQRRIEGKKNNHWVAVGFAADIKSANEKFRKLRTMLCEIYRREQKSLPF